MSRRVVFIICSFKLPFNNFTMAHLLLRFPLIFVQFSVGGETFYYLQESEEEF